MSRSGYILDSWDDDGATACWVGAVRSAIRGRRGQAFLRELIAALDAMPVKALIADDLVTESGECCAIGAVALARGQDVSEIEPEDPVAVADAFGIARTLASEIEFQNDDDGKWLALHYWRGLHEIGSDGHYCETPEQRWQRMRHWVASQIIVAPEELEAST
jgi:hypothetical protein